MAPAQLRISGPLQAAIIALVIGFLHRNTPAGAAASLWPFVLAAYGSLAAALPWLAGSLEKAEFSLRSSVFLGIAFALPMAISAFWLRDSPYGVIAAGAAVLVALWCMHFLFAVTLRLRSDNHKP